MLSQTILFGPALPYNKLKKFKVKTIIDLREKPHGYIDLPHGIEYINFPIKDDGVPKLKDFIKLATYIYSL